MNVLSKITKKQQEEDEGKVPAMNLQSSEHLISIISSLIKYTEGVMLDRVIYKFAENECQKMERLIELRDYYKKKVLSIDSKQEKIHEESDITEEELMIEKLGNGLYTLQLTDFIIAFLVTLDNQEVRSFYHF